MLNNEKICLLGLKFSVLWESTEHKSYQTIPGIRPSGCICLKSRAKWSGRAQTARCQLRRMPALERPLSCGGVCAQLQRAIKGLPLNWSCKFPIFSLLRLESAFATLLLLYAAKKSVVLLSESGRRARWGWILPLQVQGATSSFQVLLLKNFKDENKKFREHNFTKLKGMLKGKVSQLLVWQARVSISE